MPFEITISRPGHDPERHAVDAALSVGGSRADGLLIPELPHGALRLVPAAAGLVVENSAPGLRVGGHPVAPGARRLLRPGERAELRETAIALRPAAPPADPGTRCAAAALLRDAAAGLPHAGARLVVLTGACAGAFHPLRREQTVGRGRDAAIRLADARASRVHARIRVEEHGASIEDLGSKNGVRVNGVRIDPRRRSPLEPGDEILLGDTALAVEQTWENAPDEARAPRPRERRSRTVLRLSAAALLALAAALALAAS